MKIILIPLLFSLSAQAGVPKPNSPLPSGVRCESVKQSSILDLPGFCKEALDKRRLVDYGYQLDVLDACGEEAVAKSLKAALQAKVHRADISTCTEIAEELVNDLGAENAK